ncbi:MAG TPA: TIGR03960 family B12-binding radical SAM protein [Thermodesulfobacteriota bacterium]|nr:TIGR03960 family B12-binding radical SAM protein [Thermodesulfobacteriota bacterium]
MDGDRLKEFLSLVSKPVRYLGHEIHSIRKDPAEVRLNFCLAFPDVYEVGMSHLGMQILYHILNGRKGIACERAFAPWVDMEKVLREKRIPFSSLESSTPLSQFDIVGFSLQYELCLTNVLNMLNLSNIPLFSEDRDERFPLIIAGGPLTFNPAPVADFFDAMVIGDGEEVVLEICDLALQWKEAKAKREDLLKSLSQLEGVYVPNLHTDGQTIRKRVISDLNQTFFPSCPIVPYMKVVHDRLNIEIARGCKRGCRFCEAGFIHRPYRERSPKVIHEILNASLKQTGYEELSLLSLSAGDYSCIGPLLSDLMDRFEPKKVAVSFPSLRIESVVGHLAEEVKRVRKTGFTIAPEAGTERLRKVINKELDERVFFQGVSDLFSKGWKNVKLYFMMGLPTEKEEDLRGILEMTRKIASLGERQKIHPTINVSVSTFVPKPHTPFQWESQIPLEEMKQRLHLIRDGVKRNHLRFKWQDPHLSFLEGIFATGNRNLSKVLVEAYRVGCRFDGWSDQFSYPLWKEAFEKMGLEMDASTRKREFKDPLPWSFVNAGMDPQFLWEEYQRGLEEKISPPCIKENCHRCGICDGKSIAIREGDPAEMKSPRGMAKKDMRKKGIKKKIRLKFRKVGEMRFLSHLELAHLFYRASLRAELPLCFSEGFHPMPRIIFATALPVGMESLMEMLDMECEGDVIPLEVMEKLNQSLPPGIEIIEAAEVPPFFHLSSLSHPSTYWVPLDHLLLKEEAMPKINNVLDKKEFLVHQERDGKRRSVDIRPLIEKMELKERSEEASQWGVELVLRKMPGRTAKPIEIIGAVLGLEGEPLAQCKVIKLE